MYDFNKKKKGFRFNFRKYPKKKIRYIKVEALPKNIDFNKYSDFLEDYYRQRMYDGLYGANPYDVVLFSCLDEIPHPDSVKKILTFNKYNRKIGICFQKMMAFNYNFQTSTESRWFNLWPKKPQKTSQPVFHSPFLNNGPYRGPSNLLQHY